MSESANTGDAEKKSSSRAGRDLPAAIGVGLGLVVMIVISLFYAKTVFAFIVMAALTIGVFELASAMRTGGIKLPAVPVAAGGVIAMLVAYFGGSLEYVLLTFAVTILAIFLVRMPAGPEGFVRDASAGFLSLGYLFLMGTLVMLMLAEVDGHWRVLAFIACTAGSDIGGYAVGVLFGKHPLAPKISPKKSWEGLAGSAAVGILIGSLIAVFGFETDWWIGAILGIAAAVFGTFGDLCESMIKRDLGIKDMGNLLPGHGGIMDRLDSLLIVAPVAFVVMYALI